MNMILKRTTQLFFTLAMVVMLTSCSTRFFYNQLDWLMPWYLDDYVSVESHQEPYFDKTVDNFLTWHRYQQLPSYSDFLGRLQTLVDQPSLETLNQQFLKLDGFITTLYQEFGSQFSPLVSILSVEQKQILIENIREKNQEYAEDFIVIGEVAARKKGQEKIEEIVEKWLGSLKEDQQQIIYQFSLNTKWMAPGLLQARQKWVDELETTLLNKTVNEQKVAPFFDNRRLFWSADLQQQYRQNSDLLASFILQLLSSADSDQKLHLLDRLNDYQQDFIQLSKRE